MLNKLTKVSEWTDPGQTGRIIGIVNQNIMELAADASFIYWITGEDR